MSSMESDTTPKALMNIRVFGAEEFGNELQWRLDRPVAVCVTALDEIMIADAHNCVHVFDQRGGWLRTFGTPGDFAGKMQNILQICANKTGEFVVVAMKGRQFKFQLYDSNGNFMSEFGMRDAKSCHGIAIDKENRILSVDGGGKVVLFYGNGTKIIELKCKRVQFPAGIGVNDQELIFIGDRDNHCVQVYNYKGLFQYSIGGDILTPQLIGLTISGQEDVLLVEIRQGKLGVSLFKQDGTWRSYSEAPERFQKGVAFALLSNENIVVTTKNSRVFIYEQTNKLRTPVLEPTQLQPLQPDNSQASLQPHLQPDCSRAPYQMQHFRPDNIQTFRQSPPRHDHFGASRKSNHLPDNFPAPSMHQHHGHFGSQAHIRQQLFHQNFQAPTQHEYRGPGRFPTPSRLTQNPSGDIQANYSNYYLHGIEQAQPRQNIRPIYFQTPTLTRPLQPNMGQIVVSHIGSRQPDGSNSAFNDQRNRELGLHRPVNFSNNNNGSRFHQQQAGAPQQYLYSLPIVSAVPLRPHAVGLPSLGNNYNEHFSPRKWREIEEQEAVKRSAYELHIQQYQQEQREKDTKRMKSRFDRETVEISQDLQALCLPSDGGFATSAPTRQLELLDLEKGPLADTLQATVDLNASMDLTDHPLLSPSLPCDKSFQAQQIQDSTCALPLRYDKIFASRNPALVAISEATPSRQYISNCGYIKDFLKPCAVAVDSDDNVIVVDAGDNRVLVYNKHGRSLFSFGEEGSGSGQLVKPRKVAADPQTRTIVVLEGTDIPRIKIFSREGKFLNSFLSGEITKPRAMTVGKRSEIAVVQFSVDKHVVMHKLNGDLIRTIKCNDFKSPTGIAVGHYEFFISDSTDNCVKVYNFDGQLLLRVGNERSTPSPIGVAIASDGHVAVVDTYTDFRMTLFSTMGEFSAGYYSQKRHRNFEGFALTSSDDVVLICDDGKLWYYETGRSRHESSFRPEKGLTRK